MCFYQRLTIDRYNHTNSSCSFKFIDFMNTDLDDSPMKENFGPVDVELARIIRSIFSYYKYEPYNPYVFHKVVPSARNIHPNEAYLINDGRIWRFNSKRNNFEQHGYSKELKGKLWIVVASELWRIMKFYGEFGLALSLLDAGHILAELRLRLVSAGYERAGLHPGTPKTGLYQDIGLSENSVYINYTIELSSYLVREYDEKSISFATRRFQYDEEISRYPGVTYFLRQQQKGIEVPIVYTAAAMEGKDVLQYDKLRSSGHSTQGLFSTTDRLPAVQVEKYALGVAGYLKNYLGDQEQYRVGFLFRETAGEEHILWATGAGITTPKRMEAVQKENLLHDSYEHINMNSIPLNVIIVYRRDEAATEEVNIYNAHIGAGEISQYVSLMAAGDGFFSRPMKNFNDIYLAGLLCCDKERESILYTTIIGKENQKGYIFYL